MRMKISSSLKIKELENVDKFFINEFEFNELNFKRIVKKFIVELKYNYIYN